MSLYIYVLNICRVYNVQCGYFGSDFSSILRKSLVTEMSFSHDSGQDSVGIRDLERYCHLDKTRTPQVTPSVLGVCRYLINFEPSKLTP